MGWKPWSKRSGNSIGSGRTDDGKWDSQGGWKQKKIGKILEHCVIFCNRKSTKRQEPQRSQKEG